MADEQEEEKVPDRIPVSDLKDWEDLRGKWVKRGERGPKFRFAAVVPSRNTFGLNDAECVVLYDGNNSSSQRPSFNDDWLVISRSRFESDYLYGEKTDGNSGGGGGGWFS
jgi:hypothetical protein